LEHPKTTLFFFFHQHMQSKDYIRSGFPTIFSPTHIPSRPFVFCHGHIFQFCRSFYPWSSHSSRVRYESRRFLVSTLAVLCFLCLTNFQLSSKFVRFFFTKGLRSPACTSKFAHKVYVKLVRVNTPIANKSLRITIRNVSTFA